VDQARQKYELVFISNIQHQYGIHTTKRKCFLKRCRDVLPDCSTTWDSWKIGCGK